MILRYSAFLFALFFTVSLSSAEETVALAVVNGDTITSDDVIRELMAIHSEQSEEVSRPDFDVARLVHSLINDRLIVQDALALGLDQEDKMKETVGWFRETMAYQLLLSDLSPKTEIPESEIRDAFEKLYRRVQSRMICVVDSSASAAIADSIRMGIPMATLATRNAIDKYKDFGGDAGTHPLFDISEDLSKRFEANPVGTLLGPMFLWGVWVVTRAENFLPADEALYDSVKTLVQQQLMFERAEKLRRDLIAREGATIPLKIDSAAIETVLNKALNGLDGTDAPVVTVGSDRILTEEDLRKKFAHRAASRSDRDNHAVINEVLDEQVQTMMLKEIATRTNYVNDPRLDSDALAFRDSMLVVHYLQTVIGPTVKVSDTEIETYYNQNREQFREPGRVRVAAITRKTQEEAEADYEKILAGADFAWIAEKYSIDNFAKQGGLRDWISLREFPPFMSAQFDTMQIGSCMMPVQGDEGFIVMKLIERERGEILPLERTKVSIKSMIEQQKQFETIDRTIQDLREHSNITVNQDALNAFHPIGDGE